MSDGGTLILTGLLAFCAGYLCACWRAASELVPRIRKPGP